MAWASASFDPANVAQNSDAASSALLEANTASGAAAAASSRIAESSATWGAGGATPMYGGSGTFNTISGVTVAIGATLGGSAYAVAITPRGSSVLDIGPIGICGKSKTQFVVKNLGSESAASFDWILRDNG